MQCHYYQQKECLSCHWIETPYQTQLTNKQNQLSQALTPFNPVHVFTPCASREIAFRNKAKMAVLGTVEKPILGIQTNNLMVDLCDCPLYSNNMRHVLKIVRTFIRKQKLVPYNVNKKKGELKFVILTESDSGFMLRFVLRSNKFIDVIQNSLPTLQTLVNNLLVVSINIQPIAAAILEGNEEIVLTPTAYLPITLNNIPLFIKPKSFFQTNTDVAANLYKTASDWVTNLPLFSIWDLFCGVGGFGLQCVNAFENKKIKLTGIEINQDAIDCATKSAQQIGFDSLSFKALDVAEYALEQHDSPDLVLLNPPRRGVGSKLMQYLQQIAPNYILYSSCNVTSLVEDLAVLTNYQLNKVQLFDMFPHTSHMEVLVLLCKNN